MVSEVAPSDKAHLIAVLQDKLDRARMRRNRAQSDAEFNAAVEVCNETLEQLERLGANPVAKVPSTQL